MQTSEIKLNKVIYGKSEEKLKEFPDNFFDAIITDPPYEMNFMGKNWDASGIAYNINLWKEVLRIAKPGAFLFCFGGTRTYHRVVCAIEDAGWQIRDQMMWIYGEGFPKSTNISKQLDKEAGVEREVIDKIKTPYTSKDTWKNSSMHKTTDEKGYRYEEVTIPVTNFAKQWNGYGTGLKPAWEPIIIAMKPLEQGLSYTENAIKWGVAGLNIDGGRIEAKQGEYDIRHYTNEDCFINDKPKESKFQVKPQPSGRWPANLILSHSPDCIFIGTKEINEGAPEGGYFYNDREYQVEGFIKNNKPQASSNRGKETVEVWACVPDCPIRIMDSQSGQVGAFGKENKIRIRGNKKSTFNSCDLIYGQDYNDSGGASRFFYCAKAKRSERENGCKDFIECTRCGSFTSDYHLVENNGIKIKERCIRNNHPTVKPLDLMKYLCNLIKMPNENQIILDPFCGSGTTLVAAEQLGINYIGIDQDSDNVLISTARVGA